MSDERDELDNLSADITPEGGSGNGATIPTVNRLAALQAELQQEVAARSARCEQKINAALQEEGCTIQVQQLIVNGQPGPVQFVVVPKTER